MRMSGFSVLLASRCGQLRVLRQPKPEPAQPGRSDCDKQGLRGTLAASYIIRRYRGILGPRPAALLLNHPFGTPLECFAVVCARRLLALPIEIGVDSGISSQARLDLPIEIQQPIRFNQLPGQHRLHICNILLVTALDLRQGLAVEVIMAKFYRARGRDEPATLPPSGEGRNEIIRRRHLDIDIKQFLCSF